MAFADFIMFAHINNLTTRKVLNMEKEIVEPKKNKNTSYIKKGFGHSESKKEKNMDLNTDISENNPFNPKVILSPKN